MLAGFSASQLSLYQPSFVLLASTLPMSFFHNPSREVGFTDKNDAISQGFLSLPFSQCNFAKVILLTVLIATLAGCGASEDPAAAERLKSAGAITMKAEGKIYQVIVNQKMTPEIAADIAKLGNLKNLNFRAAQLDDDLLATAVSSLNPVSIVLTDTAVTDVGMAAMAGYSRIEAIFLTNTAITDEGLKPLGKLASLAELNLDNTQITDDGLTHLAGLSKLKRLVLNNTSIGDAGLEEIHSLTELSKLDAANTQITPAGIKALTTAIPGLVVAQ